MMTPLVLCKRIFPLLIPKNSASVRHWPEWSCQIRVFPSLGNLSWASVEARGLETRSSSCEARLSGMVRVKEICSSSVRKKMKLTLWPRHGVSLLRRVPAPHALHVREFLGPYVPFPPWQQRQRQLYGRRLVSYAPYLFQHVLAP